MTVYGDGRIAATLRDTPVPEDQPIVAVDSVRDPHTVSALASASDRIRDETGSPRALTVSADGSLLVFVSGPVASNAPCPRCVLLQLARRREQATALLEGDEVPPSDGAVDRVGDLTKDVLSGFDTAVPSVSVVDVDGGETVRTTVAISHPCCDHAPIARWIKGDADRPTTEEVLDRIADPYVGVVRTFDSLEDRGYLADALSDYHLVRCQFSVPAVGTYGRGFEATDLAVGADRRSDRARTRAVMEGVERFCALAPRRPDLHDTPAAIEWPHLGPQAFYLYGPDQYAREEFPFDRTGVDDVQRWSLASAYGDSGVVAVPQEFVTMIARSGVKRTLVRTNTSGVAAHVDVDAAAGTAILELFERDAIVRSWYGGDTLDAFEPSTLPAEITAYCDAVARLGYDVFVLDATRYEGVPCVVVASFRDAVPAAVLTAGSGRTYAAAAAGAFRETVEALALSATLPEGLTPLADPEAVRTSGDHFRFYAAPENRAQARSLVGDVKLPFPPAAGPTAPLVDVVADLPVDVYATELTTVGLRRAGCHVVRALSPDLVPITFGYGMERLAHPECPVADDAPGPVHPFS